MGEASRHGLATASLDGATRHQSTGALEWREVVADASRFRFVGIVGEAGQPFVEAQGDQTRGTVALLGDDEFRQTLDRLVFRLVVLFTVDEQHDVGVLLDGPGLA